MFIVPFALPHIRKRAQTRVPHLVGGTLHVNTEDMELAGEVLQDLCVALQITELESIADFPQVSFKGFALGGFSLMGVDHGVAL
jgi:hypothetical protein